MELRLANRGDMYALWLWENDPEAMAAYRRTQPLTWEGHTRWCATHLGELFWIGTVADQPVGYVRFDGPVLSYAVAPESRGRGYGRELVTLGVKALQARRGPQDVVAVVYPENLGSRRVFERLGWTGTLEGDRMVYRC